MAANTFERPKADTAITLHIPAQTRDLIDRAAATVDKSRTGFVLESARERAVDALLDQRALQLDAPARAAFAKVLSEPPPPLAKLRKRMANPSPWE